MRPEEFRKIVREEAADAVNTANMYVVEKTVIKVLANFGIDDPKKMHRLINYVEESMLSKSYVKRGFLLKVGGWAAGTGLTVGAVLAIMAGQG